MKRVILNHQSGFLFGRQNVMNEREINAFISAVNFVAHDGMSQVREVNSDLMLASGEQADAQQGERAALVLEMPQKTSVRFGFGATRDDGVLDRNGAVQI